jgi:hypothetical protein
LLFLRFQRLRGVLDESGYRREVELVRDTLAKLRDAHWREFVDRWK